MVNKYEEIPPGTALINSIRAEKSPYYAWAGEAIDNSLDAGASIVALEMLKDRLDCLDDGSGITKKHEQDIVQISAHGEMVGTRLGRFGVGIKQKSIQHGKAFVIESISKDGLLRRNVNWEYMLKNGHWLYPESMWSQVKPGTPTQTFVSIRGLITKPPAKADIQRTNEEIGRRYYPALNAGKTISLNGEPVAPIPHPALRDVIDATLKFGGGRTAHIHGGMLVDPTQQQKLKQVDICCAFRVIKPGSSFGCNGYGGIRSLFATVELNGKWLLTKFKDDIAEDPYLEELEAAVEETLRPILEQCRSQSMTLRIQQIQHLLNEMIPEGLRAARPEQKQKLDRKGPKRGDKTPRDVSDSVISPTGPVHAKKKPPRGILIEFVSNLCEEYGYGRAQVEKSQSRIQLAADHPTISDLMASRDMNMVANALFAIASLIYEAHIQDISAQGQLFNEPLGLRASRLLGYPKVIQPEAA
jgi:hypothetical protein